MQLLPSKLLQQKGDLIKVLKLQIHKPREITWDSLGKLLRELDYLTPKAYNYCLTQLFVWQAAREQFNRDNGHYPKDEMPQPNLYKEVRANFPDIPSTTVSSITQKAKSKWTGPDGKGVRNLKRALPTYKKGQPIPITKQSSELEVIDGELVFSAHLVDVGGKRPPKTQIVIKTPTRQIKKGVFIKDASKALIIERLIDGTYERKEAMIQHKKNKWFLLVCYEPPKRKVVLDYFKVCGVDLGLVKPFYCAVGEYDRRCPKDKKEVERFRAQIKARRIAIGKCIPISNRRGRGYKRKHKPLENLTNKERNYRDNKYHHYSRSIVDFAVRNGCGIIQMEDLSDFKARQDGFLRDWAINDLQTKVEYKYAEYGGVVMYADPAYTSQRCSQCGEISADNRKTQGEFKCVACGYEANADYNAAKNLCVPYIDVVIALKLGLLTKFQEDLKSTKDKEIKKKIKKRIKKLEKRIEEYKGRDDVAA